MRRGAAALLLLAAAACHVRKEQSIAPVQPQALYAKGRDALQRGDNKAAEWIAHDGGTKFAAQPQWRELFAVLEAEAIVRDDRPRAMAILDHAPTTGAPEAAVRRLIVGAAAQKWEDANKTLLQADALAARVMPSLQPEIASRRILPLYFLKKPDEMERAAQRAIDGAETTKQPWLAALAHFYRAHAASQEREWAKAIGSYESAVKYAHAAQATATEIKARANLGWCYLEAGNFDDALKNLGPAAEQQTIREYQHTALVNIADVYDRRLEFDKALPYARRALAVAQKDKELANSYHLIGQIEFGMGHYDAAKIWNDRAVAKRPKADQWGALTDSFNEARILNATGDPASALKILGRIPASPEAKKHPALLWRAQGIEAGIHAKLAHFREAERMYEATLATGAGEREKVQGESSFAFERNFLSFYDGYIELLLNENDPRRALQVAERSRARTLRDAIALGSSKEVDPVALARQKNATLLFYWLGAKRSLLWTVTPRGISVAKLPADDVIDKAADNYRKELQSSRHKLAASTLGPQLYEMLVAPAGNIAPGSRVIIFPDAHLRALSFDALIVPAKPPRYWIDDVTISYSPSLHLLASTPAWKLVPDGRALVFGDVPGEGREFPKLKRAKDEILQVARHFGSRAVVRSGTTATPSAYAAAEPRQFQFIHFAAHATASTDRPLESAVILAPDANGFSLTGQRIVQLPLAAELVTVSSCNSAGRRYYAGEGLVGLAWAFLRAGARRVVAAQWDVNDSAAPPMMDKMYAAMVGDGVEPAVALRRAKLALLHSDSPLKDPLYWAPFVVY